MARFETVAAPFGEDALLQFHRQIGYVGLAFVLIHVAISAHWGQLTFHNAINAPALVWFGMAAVLSLLALIASSVWRKRLRLSYEWWHRAHTVLAVVVVVIDELAERMNLALLVIASLVFALIQR